MLNKTVNLLLFGLFLSIVFNGSSIDRNSSYHTSGAVNLQPDDIRVLILVAPGFGHNYFDVKERFESWGCQVTTAGTTSSVPSCPHKDPRPINSDILISNIHQEALSEYHCVFVPSGGYWSSLANQPKFLSLVTMAHNSGLVVASMCVGTAALGYANVIYGVKILTHDNTRSVIQSAGGIIVEDDVEVVSDRRVITGGPGGGWTGGGADAAPTKKTCVAIVKVVLGYSYVLNTTLETSGANCTIAVETTTLAQELPDMFSTYNQISRVTANIYSQNGSDLIETVRLDHVGSGIFSENFTVSESGQYYVDLEVKDNKKGLEVIRNVKTFVAEGISNEEPGSGSDVESSTSTKEITTEESTPGYGLFAIIGSVALILCIKSRRRVTKRTLLVVFV